MFSYFPNALVFAKDLDENNTCYENLDAQQDINLIPEDISLYDVISLENAKKQDIFINLKIKSF